MFQVGYALYTNYPIFQGKILIALAISRKIGTHEYWKQSLSNIYIHYEAPKCFYVLVLVFHMRVLSSIQTFTLTGNHASFILFLWEWNNDFVSRPVPMVYFLMPESFFSILAWFYLQVQPQPLSHIQNIV